MELIPINESKLKIMLDEIDMREYRLGASSDCADTETRRAIRSILDVARKKIGFNTEGAEIFVQLYASKKGGCELFVTKGETLDGTDCEIDYQAEGISPHSPIKDARQSPSPSKSKKKDSAKTTSSELTVRSGALPSSKKHDMGKIAYSFASLYDLCRVCSILHKRNTPIESRAVRDDGGIFYLVLYNTGLGAFSRLDKLSFICEFGTRESLDGLGTYLYEHGKVICDSQAVETLGAMW